jgi:hypothetical protein
MFVSKRLKQLILILLLAMVSVHVKAEQSYEALYQKIEAAGMFDKIRMNMIFSCYINRRQAPKQISLETLKSLYPDRAAACSCLETELGKIDNRAIFNDSLKASNLKKSIVAAKKNNDQKKLEELRSQKQAFKPFLSVIVKRCGL